MPGRPEVGYGSLVQTVIEIRVCVRVSILLSLRCGCVHLSDLSLDRALLTPLERYVQYTLL